jgi:hypothetical protein
MQNPAPRMDQAQALILSQKKLSLALLAEFLFCFSLLLFWLLREENIFPFLRDPLKCGMAADSVRDYNFNFISNNTTPTSPASSTLKANISDMLFWTLWFDIYSKEL